MNRILSILLLIIFNSNLLQAQKFIGEAKEDEYIRKAIEDDIKKAKKGNIESQYILGIYYLTGIHIEKDIASALRWIGKARDKNYAKALEFFGDIEENDSISELYYQRAISHFNAYDRFPISISEIEYKITRLSKNKRLLYLDVASKFLMGEYQECSTIGDSIDVVEDIYDAMILCYSSLANHKLAFEERKIDHSENVYLPNFHRAQVKAGQALDFLLDDMEDDYSDSIINSTFFIDKLQSYSLAISCCRIIQTPLYRQFLNFIHTRILPIKLRLSAGMLLQKIELDYYDIMYNIEKEHISLAIETLIPQFESEIIELNEVDGYTKSLIATLYNQLSEYLNYTALKKGKDDSFLMIAALNTMIHSRDYQFFAKRGSAKESFRLIDWNQIKDIMPDNSMSFLFFEYAQDGDSWNYAWNFSNTSLIPNVEYSGHSYWSESQGMWSVQKYQNVDSFFVVGTNSMMLTDYSNDIRVVRLHSISDLLTRKQYYNNEQVHVIGKINYSFYETDVISENKGASHTVGNFSSAEMEIKAISDAFGPKMKLYQGNEVTRQLFEDFSTQKGILHISTHGVFNKDLLKNFNRRNPTAGLTGENILRSCGLMLSGYNNDKEKNFISAYEIRQLQLKDIELVFISACESGAGKVLLTGVFSLAEAFHLSGVKNIIAVIDPISEIVATRFAESFYNQVSNKMSYHDAFYKTKKQICPNDRIILFE